MTTSLQSAYLATKSSVFVILHKINKSKGLHLLLATHIFIVPSVCVHKSVLMDVPATHVRHFYRGEARQHRLRKVQVVPKHHLLPTHLDECMSPIREGFQTPILRRQTSKR